MNTAEQQQSADELAARTCLEHSVATMNDDGVERRHESLMAWAESVLALDRAFAEQLYALAEEEQLEPIYAFQLIRCGIGVRELATPAQDVEEFAASQEAPPAWVGEPGVELSDVALERRLRATFRRFRAQLDTAATPTAAVAAFLAEPDIGMVDLRP
ncbi:MAG TPA: hypothetical protein VMN60_10440 [Longimicrobiales bacterium]|nr:hypothetical protein [Longimicrobiales bacterium]